MDKVLSELNNSVQKAIGETLTAKEKCEALRAKAVGEQLMKLDSLAASLEYRLERLAIISDILTGRAFVVVEKDGQLMVQKGGNARLLSLAQKQGIPATFIESKEELKDEKQEKML